MKTVAAGAGAAAFLWVGGWAVARAARRVIADEALKTAWNAAGAGDEEMTNAEATDEAKTGEAAGDAQKRPNVLFIAVDDLRPELGCYGHEQILSPNIDKLAASGIRLDRAYCQQAICAASRASLLSGCRPDTTRIYDLNHPLRQMMPDVVSLPQLFRNHGYTTISLGKIYHHRDDDLVGWSEKPTREKGGWTGRGYLAPESLKAVRKAAQGGKSKPGIGPAFEGPDVSDDAYPDGVVAKQAVQRLRKFAKTGERFFLAVGFYKPHLPFNAPKKYWDLYPPEKIHPPTNGKPPVGATKYTLTNWGEMRQYTNIPKTGPCSDKLTRELIHGYYACVSYTDAMVGRVVGELDRLGLRENTVIVLWGDHGWKLGEYGSWCKHTNVEYDTHVPMIFSGPGVKPGQSSKGLCEFVDIYPTLAELCGLVPPKSCEGASLVPLMNAPDRPWKSAAMSQYPRGGGIMGYTMRTDRWRYTRWVDRRTRKTQAEELYDHQADPGENRNVIGSADAGLLAQLRAQADAGWKAARPGR